MLPFAIFGGFGLVLLGWQMFESLRTMEIRMRGGAVIRRNEKPKLFWLIIALQLPIMAIFLWLVLFAR
jgi:hypothetical protein